MWRFTKFLVHCVLVVAIAAVGFAAIEKTSVPGAGGIAAGIVAAAGGLVLGLIFAWLRGIPWQRLPALMVIWRANFARQCAWTALGCASLAVLVYY